MRILLAEAEEGGLDDVAEALKDAGHEVFVVNDRLMLFETLNTRKIDLVILDDMLTLRRVDAVNRIRTDVRFADPETLAIIVIFFLGDAELAFPKEYNIMQFEQSKVPSEAFFTVIESIVQKD